MKIIDVGNGPPVVVIPGVQGRWEWNRPAIQALARSCRVITFSLADEPTCGGHFDESTGFDCYVEQVRTVLDAMGLERAAICGVSYAGLVGAAFAARHPDRTSCLVLVSALSPAWRPDARVSFYLRAPRLLSPIFCLVSPVRMYQEIASATRGTRARLRLAATAGWTVLTHMFSPSRMARRVRLLAKVDLLPELERTRVPTLLVTGESRLDRVVPVRITHEYRTFWPHAEVATLESTGHIGIVTRPDAFAAVVGEFVHRHADAEHARRRSG